MKTYIKEGLPKEGFVSLFSACLKKKQNKQNAKSKEPETSVQTSLGDILFRWREGPSLSSQDQQSEMAF
jgi:hypothetical protein